MKKFTVLLSLIAGLVSIQAQDSMSNDSINQINRTLILKLGVNIVDSSGQSDPFQAFTGFEESAFTNNYNVEFEYRISNWFSLSAALSNNKWEANKGKIDGTIINFEQKYFAIDFDLRCYFDEAFGWFDRNDWIELYLYGGLGAATQFNNQNITYNFGPGVNFWLTDQFGLNFNSTGKWLPNPDQIYGSNHIQHSASLMYRFIDNDVDNDGVKNEFDECPNIPGSALNYGCPDGIKERHIDAAVADTDADGDGVFGLADNCPEIKGLPTNKGCPLPDTDNDGVVDVADMCINIPGPESNNGCPYEKIMIVKSETDVELNIEDVLKVILFNKGNANFRQNEYPMLIKIAEMIKQQPNTKFKIEGHSDSVGDYKSNQTLSLARANAVRNYLINSGIPPENLVIEGHGETRPVDSNLTVRGQSLNRRVEISVIK